MSFAFNVIISGVSVSGDLDTDHTQFQLQLGNSDTIGSVGFSLQNSGGGYSRMTMSGNATIQVDAVPAPGVTRTMFRGTVETLEPEISADRGMVVRVEAYDYGQELLGLLSPDARIPSALTATGTPSLLMQSGDQGMATSQGQDLVLFVSGANFGSGATVAAFMSQYFGTATDTTGSASGTLFTFKPYFSGQTLSTAYRTYYVPDASGLVALNDNNLKYLLPLDSLKIKRQYAWDVLKKLTRQAVAVNLSGDKVQFECYIGVSGDIHVFTSGSYELFASGVVFQYYVAGASGSALNNIITAKIPHDTVKLKNVLVGSFPPWTQYPLDGDSWTDVVAYSGGNWSGTALAGFSPATILLSGGKPSSNTGFISIQAFGSGAGNATEILSFSYWSGLNLNINKFNVIQPLAAVVGVNAGVTLNFNWYSNQPAVVTAPLMIVTIYDNGLVNFIQTRNSITIPTSGWTTLSIPIYGSGGAFNSGVWLASAPFPDLTKVRQIQLQPTYALPAGPGGYVISAVDNLFLSFLDPFSPIEIYNSGSISIYGRRVATLDYPYQTTDLDASGIILHELLARMASKQVAQLTVKDNPGQPFPYQILLNPGQVFVVDAPTLNTGSGQFFNYWRATKVTHIWDTKNGFQTRINAVPWFSGTIAGSGSLQQGNIIDYQLPVLDEPSTSRRSDYLPTPYVGYVP